jgi:serine/threonine protein kinase
MHHLHEEGLLHRDLAARNILLTSSNEPVVADFGLSKKVDKLHQSGKDNTVKETGFFRGPYKWMAVESLQRNEFSKKTDVWSYGIADGNRCVVFSSRVRRRDVVGDLVEVASVPRARHLPSRCATARLF